MAVAKATSVISSPNTIVKSVTTLAPPDVFKAWIQVSAPVKSVLLEA